MMTQWLGAYGLPYLHADEHAAAFVPGKKPLLVVGNDGGLAVSGDGGASWSFDKNAGISTAAIYGLASTPADPHEILIGTQDTGTLLRQGNTGTFNEVLGGDGLVPAIGQANSSVSLGSVYNDEIWRSTAHTQNQVNEVVAVQRIRRRRLLLHAPRRGVGGLGSDGGGLLHLYPAQGAGDDRRRPQLALDPLGGSQRPTDRAVLDDEPGGRP